MSRLWIAASLACALAGSIAHAQPAGGAQDGAREHFRKGTVSYNLGKYADAAREYELTYEITMDPVLLFNLGQAYRMAGQREKAITAYRSYLRNVPNAPRREFVEQKIRDLEKQKSLPAASPPKTAADTTMEESPAIAAPAPKKPEPSPAVVQPPAAVPPAAMTTVPGTARPEPAPMVTVSKPQTAAEEDSPPFYRRWPFLVGAGALVVAGAVVAALLVTRQNDLSMPANDYGTRRF